MLKLKALHTLRVIYINEIINRTIKNIGNHHQNNKGHILQKPIELFNKSNLSIYTHVFPAQEKKLKKNLVTRWQKISTGVWYKINEIGPELISENDTSLKH